MGITEVTVPKQYVLVQTTEPTGAFEGQLWYDSSEDLTYIFQDNDWQLITLDISQEVLDLATENAQQQIDIIELQANASVTPFDHDTLLSDTFSDADGYKDSVNTGNTDAEFDTNLYKRTNQTDLKTGLMSYYKLDDTNGTTIDSYAGINGNNVNIVQGQTGIIGTDYNFNGTTSDVTLTDTQFDFLTNHTNNAFTISLWAKQTTIGASTSNPLFSKFGYYPGSSNNTGFAIDVRANGVIYINEYKDNSNYRLYQSPNTNLLDGSFHHVVVTQSNGYTTTKLFVDGTEIALTPTTQGTPASVNISDKARIGSDTKNNIFSSQVGAIDEVGIWNRVLTADEITTLYNSGAGLSYDNFEFEQTQPKTVEIDLPTITGTITHTELVTNSIIETGASITYKLNNGTTDDTEETPNTKNAYNLTGVPTKLKILLNPKETEATNGNPSIKSYCLKLWKA